MKNIFVLFIVCLISSISQAQSLTFEQTQDIEFAKNVNNDSEFKSYTTHDGSTISIGDKLKIGTPSTNSGSFTHLYLGKFNVGNAMLGGAQPAAASLTGEVVIVDRIYVHHTKMSKKSPLSIMMYVRNPDRPKLAWMRTILDFEKSMAVGEVINPNAAITREEAITKLKEAKDLLDLQVISQQKYDSIKTALLPLINKN